MSLVRQVVLTHQTSKLRLEFTNPRKAPSFGWELPYSEMIRFETPSGRTPCPQRREEQVSARRAGAVDESEQDLSVSQAPGPALWAC